MSDNTATTAYPTSTSIPPQPVESAHAEQPAYPDYAQAPVPPAPPAPKRRRLGGGALAAIISGGVLLLALVFGGGVALGWVIGSSSVSQQFPGGELPDGTQMGPPGQDGEMPQAPDGTENGDDS